MANVSGTPEGTRTPNIQNRNLTLYPIELRTHLLTALRYYIRILPVCKEDFPLFYFSFSRRRHQHIFTGGWASPHTAATQPAPP